jgi:hypothetical protein
MVNTLVEKGWDATLMDVHNETGFRSKPINAAKATLYSLMHPGSTIIVPDSLWNCPFWGGMLAGAALRGCKVLVIAPALENAPSSGFPKAGQTLINVLTICMGPITIPSWDGSRLEIVEF